MILFSARATLVRLLKSLASLVLVMLVVYATTWLVGEGGLEGREDVRELSVPEGRKVAGAYWRDGDVWVLTRAAHSGEDCSDVYELRRPAGWAITRERYVVRERPAASRGGDDARDAGAEGP